MTCWASSTLLSGRALSRGRHRDLFPRAGSGSMSGVRKRKQSEASEAPTHERAATDRLRLNHRVTPRLHGCGLNLSRNRGHEAKRPRSQKVLNSCGM